MKKILVLTVALTLAASSAYAAEEIKAEEPVGAVLEATTTYAGRVISVITGQEEEETVKGTITVADDTGKAAVFPVDPAVKIVDSTLNALTLNQLKEGDKVTVEYTKEGDKEKTKSITVSK